MLIQATPGAVRVRRLKTPAAETPAKIPAVKAARAGMVIRRQDGPLAHLISRTIRVLPLALLAAALCSFEGARADTPQSCEQEIARAASRYRIPLAVFYAVGLNETGAKGRLQIYAMNIDGRPVLSATLADAMSRFRAAKASGAKMIDIGCMQINHHYHGDHFPSLQAMFDPALNIDYAARFLRELKDREKTWTMAVARYNAGPDNNPAQKRYVCGVTTKMVASGFGAWTESARNFCFGEHVARSSN